MLTTVASQRTIALWRSRLGSALRTALACALVACAMLYGPDPFRRQLTYPALSYVAAILIVSEATLGEAVRGATFAAYGTVQGVCPAILSLWVIGPARFSITTTTFAVALSAFVVALPGSTHIVTKRIALVQIVLVYVGAFMQGVRTEPIMHPVHVAISTGVGALAAVLALVLPYPRLGYYEVKEKSKLYAELASKKLKFFANAFCAENKNSAIASISQAKSLDNSAKKLLQNIKIKQETIQWERPTIKFSPAHFRSPSDRLQTLEIPLKGMEIALSSCPTFPLKSADQRLKDHVISMTEDISQTLKQLDYSRRCDSSTAPETAKEFPDKLLQPPQITFPTLQDLPSLFFLFCMKLLHDEYIATQSMELALENNTTPDEETTISDKQDPTTMKKKLSIWPIRISGKRFIAAFKCSLVLGLSVLFGMIFSKNNSYWAGLTVAISITPFREATFKGANVRAQGTVIGSIYGILGCFIPQKYMELRVLFLLPWIIFTSFLKDSKMYGQAGGISATVAAIVILGRKDLGDPNEFAIARITETFIGISCSIFVELLVQPVRASTLAKTGLSKSIGELHECVGSMVFGTQANNLSGKLVELNEKEKKLRGHVNALGKFIEEAEIEPSFWFVPFPSTCYRRLLGSLSKMADLLVFGAHAMEFLVHGSHWFRGASWKDMLEDVNGDLEHFKKVVCIPMKCFEEITRMKSLAMLEKEYEKAKNKEMDKDKEMCEDIENGKTPKHANGSWNLSDEDEEIEKVLDSFLGNAREDWGRVGEAEGEEEMKKGLVLCMGAMGFCMEGLMRETREIEKGVKELVQWENPACHVNLYEIYFKLKNACT